MTVTVIRPGAMNSVGDHASETTHTVSGCAFAQKSTADTYDRRKTATTTVKLMCPAGADIQQGDKVVADGVTYLVEGLPWTPSSPFTGWTPGKIVELKGWRNGR